MKESRELRREEKIRRRRRRKALRILSRAGVALVPVLLWALFSLTIPGVHYEFLLQDVLLRLRGQLSSPKDVVIVALDEETYRTWNLPMDRPIPRERYGKLLKQLASLGAKGAVFDIIFAGPGANPEWDLELEEGIKSLPVVLGVDHGKRDVGGNTVYDLIKPYSSFANLSRSLGLVGMQLDEGSARHFYTERNSITRDFPSLSEAGARLFNLHSGRELSLPGQHDLINFYGPAGSVKTYSLQSVLDSEVPIPPELFKDKIVYVGLLLRTGLGASQKDIFQTPYGDIFGVEIHATQAANIIDNHWIRRPAPIYELSIIGAALWLCCFFIIRSRPIQATILTVIVMAGWALASYIGLQFHLFIAGASGATIFIPAAYLINTVWWYLWTRKRQVEVERAFSLYVSPAMIAQLRRNPNALKLGGEEITATAMFTDIANFTNISESLGAVKVTAMLNAYFSEVSKVIMEEQGTVIKFIGDAVFAIWGAPVAIPDHAERACRAAIKIQEAVDNFNRSGAFPELVTRVGVNTGRMVVGNLGSEKRFDFTAIGDAVNLASRIEGANKYLDTTILVTEETLALTAADLNKLKMGSIRVVGKEIPIVLYQLSRNSFPPPASELWEKGLEHFTSRSWEEARRIFADTAEKYPPFAKASKLYIEAINEFMQQPPHEEWRGEVALDHK